VRRKEWAGLSEQEDVNRALDYLANVAGWVACREDLPTGPRGGRPAAKYVVNPRIRER
jgi:hypothetical protein